MINRKRNALTILRPQSRRRGLFCIKSKITFPRLFLFPHVCLHISQFGKQTRAHSPTFVSFPPRLFTYQPIRETNTGKSFARYALISKAGCRSHGLAVRTSSPRRSSASALSGSALYSSRLLVAARLIWHIKSTGLYA